MIKMWFYTLLCMLGSHGDAHLGFNPLVETTLEFGGCWDGRCCRCGQKFTCSSRW